MSALQEELQATLDRETARLPLGLRELAQQAIRADWEKQDASADEARRDAGRLDSRAMTEAQAEIEIACAEIAKLECDLLVARRRAMEAHNRRSHEESILKQSQRHLAKASVPTYQLEAARRVLLRLEDRLQKWKVEPPPMIRTMFTRKAKPDPRFPSEEEQKLSLDTASLIVGTALQATYNIERGLDASPADIEAWVEDVVKSVENELAVKMKDSGGDSEDLERIKAMLRMISTGAEPIYI